MEERLSARVTGFSLPKAPCRTDLRESGARLPIVDIL
jgi:hypothetical protein